MKLFKATLKGYDFPLMGTKGLMFRGLQNKSK